MTATGKLGANPQELDDLASFCDQSAERLRNIHVTTQQSVERSTWDGEDAVDFRSTWSSNAKSTFSEAARLLEDNAKILRRNAEDQRRTSDVGEPILGQCVEPGGRGGGSGRSDELQRLKEYLERLGLGPDLIEALLEAMSGADPALYEVLKNDAVLQGFKMFGDILDGVNFLADFVSAYNAKESLPPDERLLYATYVAASGILVSKGASIAAGKVAAKVGAAIGTIVAPSVGTAVGGVVGFGTGITISFAADKFDLPENFAELKLKEYQAQKAFAGLVVDAVGGAVDGVKDAAGAVVDGAKDIIGGGYDTVKGWF